MRRIESKNGHNLSLLISLLLPSHSFFFWEVFFSPFALQVIDVLSIQFDILCPTFLSVFLPLLTKFHGLYKI